MRRLFLRYSAAVAALLMIALLPISCIKDNFPSSKKASVTMTFTARARSADVPEEGSKLLDNEKMKTLRVIVARKNNVILYNEFYEIKDGETSKKITFSELTVNSSGEKFDFYAIANEEAFLEENESLSGKNIDLVGLKSRIVDKDFNTPQLSQLPQAAYKEITVTPGQNNEESMQLQFPMAKINLTFKNTTGSSQILTDVRLKNGTPDKSKLFYDGDMPTDVNIVGRNITFDDFSLDAADGATANCVRYVYPGQTGSEYVVRATWNGEEYTLTLKVDGSTTPLQNLARDKQYNVTITLKGGGGLTVSCSVADWNDLSHEVELSDRGTFVIEIENAKSIEYETGIKALATQFGNADRNIVLRLRMTKPVGVKWSAHLTNPAFEFVGDSEGVGAADSEWVKLQIQPTMDYTEGLRNVDELHVKISTKPEQKTLFVPQNLWNDLCTSNGVSIPIVQVSPQEGDKLWTNP